MADYKCHVFGHYSGGTKWSWGWYVTSTSPAATLLTTWATAVTDWWTNGTYGMDTLYPTSTILDGVDCVTLDDHFKYMARVQESLTLAGTSSDAGLPAECAMLLRLESPGLYPNQRGRTYLPAPVEGIYDGTQFSAIGAGRAGTAARALHFAIASAGNVTFVHTGAEISKHGVPAYTKTTITNVQASGKPTSQKRRTKKIAPVYY